MQAGGEALVEGAVRPGSDDPDHLLVRAALAGDGAAFDSLVDRHWRKVASVAARFLDDPNEVEDAVQETFIQAFTHLRGFRGRATVRTWLLRIAANVCRNRRRSPWKRRVTLSDVPPEGEGASLDPRQQAERDLRGAELHAAVGRLPEHLRLPLVLHFFEDLTGAEIAEVLGWNESTVWTRLYAARRELKKQLGSFGEE